MYFYNALVIKAYLNEKININVLIIKQVSYLDELDADKSVMGEVHGIALPASQDTRAFWPQIAPFTSKQPQNCTSPLIALIHLISYSTVELHCTGISRNFLCGT